MLLYPVGQLFIKHISHTSLNWLFFNSYIYFLDFSRIHFHFGYYCILIELFIGTFETSMEKKFSRDVNTLFTCTFKFI